MKVVVAEDILRANDQLARANRECFDRAGVIAINLLGSPGCGKTSLLEALFGVWPQEFPFGVIEGDLATSRDAERIEKLGVRTVQINTGGSCHLDAGMVGQALEQLDLGDLRAVFIENVGNLVCPAAYQLGESLRVAVLSLPEGDDKVAKYPSMFSRVDLIVINKIDLAPYLEFDLGRVADDLARLAPDAELLSVSARSGEGLVPLAERLIGAVKVPKED